MQEQAQSVAAGTLAADGKPFSVVMSAIWPSIVRRSDIHSRRWRYINRRRWGIVDRRGRCNVHRLRRNCASNDSSNTKSQDARSDCRTITCMSRGRERKSGNAQCRQHGGDSNHRVHFNPPSAMNGFIAPIARKCTGPQCASRFIDGLLTLRRRIP